MTTCEQTLRRALQHVRVTPDGCWLWDVTDIHGYGKTSQDNRTTSAHLWLWRAVRGNVPEGKQLDHLCRRRACVNLDHLEPVTASENIVRGHEARGSYRATNCPTCGALKTARPDGRGRRCKPCDARRARERRAAA